MKIMYVEHKNISADQLCDIAKLKSQHWDYPVESQIKWFNENLNDNDIHVMLSETGCLVGYLTITDIELSLDNDVVYCCGIGSVCTDKNHFGKGYATKLVINASMYVAESKKLCCLLCKEKLQPFYHNKCGYINVTADNIFVQNKLFSENLMVFGRQLLCDMDDVLNAKTIRINRNF